MFCWWELILDLTRKFCFDDEIWETPWTEETVTNTHRELSRTSSSYHREVTMTTFSVTESSRSVLYFLIWIFSCTEITVMMKVCSFGIWIFRISSCKVEILLELEVVANPFMGRFSLWSMLVDSMYVFVTYDMYNMQVSLVYCESPRFACESPRFASVFAGEASWSNWKFHNTKKNGFVLVWQEGPVDRDYYSDQNVALWW